MDVDARVKGYEVRLFPTIRISSEKEAEQRATAALLSMISAVSEFGRSFVKRAGGAAGAVSCFTEVSFPDESVHPPKDVRPDGVIVVTRGKTRWSALLEVKVGDNTIGQDQFDTYHRLAKQLGVNAFVTISNQAATAEGLPPGICVDGRRLKAVTVTHWSWDKLLGEARFLINASDVEDADQRWMLGEWIRYVADSRSKIVQRPHLGDHFHAVATAAREGRLSTAVLHLDDVCMRWNDFLTKAALRLRAKLGVDVSVVMSRAERADPATRLKSLQDLALADSRLNGAVRISGAAADLDLDLMLNTKTARFSAELKGPTEGRQLTRINWMIRQLKDCPDGASLTVDWGRGQRTHARVAELKDDAACLLRLPDGQPVLKDAAPKKFTVEWFRNLRKGKGRSTVVMLQGMLDDLETFYADVVEELVAFVPKAPKLPLEPKDVKDTQRERPANISQVRADANDAATTPREASVDEASMAGNELDEAPRVEIDPHLESDKGAAE